MAKKLILAIDDEKDILKLLQYNLEREGYQVSCARTGEEGLDAVKSKRPDLVLLDIMMPGIDGLEVLKILRANSQTRNVPVLMLRPIVPAVWGVVFLSALAKMNVGLERPVIFRRATAFRSSIIAIVMMIAQSKSAACLRRRLVSSQSAKMIGNVKPRMI